MPTYRAYRLDDRRHIRAAEWIEAPNDNVARAEAREELCEDGSPAVELWEGRRLVDEIECDESQDGAA